MSRCSAKAPYRLGSVWPWTQVDTGKKKSHAQHKPLGIMGYGQASSISFATHFTCKQVLLIHHQLAQLWWYIYTKAPMSESQSQVQLNFFVTFVTDQNLLWLDHAVNGYTVYVQRWCTTTNSSLELFIYHRLCFLGQDNFSTCYTQTIRQELHQYNNKRRLLLVCLIIDLHILSLKLDEMTKQ